MKNLPLSLHNKMGSIKILFCISILCFSYASNAQQWNSFKEGPRTSCSPNSTDLNGDGVEDIVMGSVDQTNVGPNMPPEGFVTVFDGETGDIIWEIGTRHEIFTKPMFMDISGDGVMDVFIGGRAAQYMAIDGSNGNVLWEFWPASNGNFYAAGWGNFYNGQFIDDINGDNVMDILTVNGGGGQSEAEIDRVTGRLVIISGADGSMLKSATVPEEKESYVPPLLHEENGIAKVFFGTGGETIGGSYYKVPLSDLLNEDVSGATAIVSSENKGFINPMSLVDLTGDQIYDYVIPFIYENLTAINGATGEEIWMYSVPGAEVYNAPTIGNFGGIDETPDILTVFLIGDWPHYTSNKIVVLDGKNSTIIYENEECIEQFGTAAALDTNDDGIDEAIIMLNTIELFNPDSSDAIVRTQLSLIDVVAQDITGMTPVNDNAMAFYNSALVKDIDGNGKADIIYSYSNVVGVSGGDVNTEDYSIFRLNSFIDGSNISWAGYMGNFSDCTYPLNVTNTEDPNGLSDEIYVYPNPTTGVINIDISDQVEMVDISLTDLLGRTIQTYLGNQKTLDVSNFPRGAYFLKLNTKNQSISKKIVLR